VKAYCHSLKSKSHIPELTEKSVESGRIVFEKISAVICVVLLFFAMYTKLIAVLRPSILSDQQDPIFSFFSLHTTASLALLAESATLLLFILFRFLDMKRESWWIVLALALSFTIYRLGAYMLNHSAPCTCLGSMSSGIFRDIRQEEVAAYLILASWLLLAICNVFNARAVFGISRGSRTTGCNSLSVLALIASFFISQANGSTIQVAGTLTAIDFSIDKTNGQTSAVQFTVKYMEQGRKLFVEHNNGVQSVTMQSDQCNFDITVDPKLTNTIPMPAIVRTNFYPIFGQWYTTIPWLAFFSDRYLPPDEYETMPLPWFVVRHDPEAHLCHSKLSFNDLESRKSLRQISWKTDMSRLRLATKNKMLGNDLEDQDDRKVRLVKFDMIYPTNVLLGTFSVSTSTQIMNHIIPTKFELIRYD
jgi:hypothetical protein